MRQNGDTRRNQRLAPFAAEHGMSDEDDEKNPFKWWSNEDNEEEVKEEKRLSPVHVDDAARSKIAKAVLAMATFEQVAGIPKKKRKKLGKVNKKTWVFV